MNIIKGMEHACDDNFNIKHLKDSINHLQSLTSSATKNVEAADHNEYILSEGTPKTCLKRCQNTPAPPPRTS